MKYRKYKKWLKSLDYWGVYTLTLLPDTNDRKSIKLIFKEWKKRNR